MWSLGGGPLIGRIIRVALSDLATIVATTENEDRHDFSLTVYGRKPRNSAKTVTACRLVTVLANRRAGRSRNTLAPLHHTSGTAEIACTAVPRIKADLPGQVQ